jgi:unsaturated rhamnogalacturonyl hydrolase
MFAYAFAKGANKGYLDSTYILRAKETFEGVVANLVTVTEEGLVDLHGTCRSAGLGGTPYRDGSAGYYTGEPKRTNDMKGIGPFILAAIEIELAQTAGSK